MNYREKKLQQQKQHTAAVATDWIKNNAKDIITVLDILCKLKAKKKCKKKAKKNHENKHKHKR